MQKILRKLTEIEKEKKRTKDESGSVGKTRNVVTENTRNE